MEAPSDSEIVLAIRKGRREAFRHLAERYWSRVRSLIRRAVKDPETTDDLCQEVFLRAFEKIHQFDTQRNFGSWIYKIGLNMVREHFRKIGRGLQVFSLMDQDLEAGYPGPDEGVIGEIMAEAILDRLPLGLRIIFVLRHSLDLNCQEISFILDEPVGTIKSHLFRIRELLRRHCLSREMASESRLE